MIFASSKSRLEHAIETVAREVAGVGAGRALAEKNAHADGSRAGFFQRFDLAEAHECGEFVAFADDAFGGGCAAFHGMRDDVLREGAEVGGELQAAGS